MSKIGIVSVRCIIKHVPYLEVSRCFMCMYTDAEISLNTLLVKYFNDLLGRQSSERGRDEVTSFYVGDLFCIHLDIKYAIEVKWFDEMDG